jgi:hypothetical protein
MLQAVCCVGHLPGIYNHPWTCDAIETLLCLSYTVQSICSISNIYLPNCWKHLILTHCPRWLISPLWNLSSWTHHAQEQFHWVFGACVLMPQGGFTPSASMSLYLFPSQSIWKLPHIAVNNMGSESRMWVGKYLKDCGLVECTILLSKSSILVIHITNNLNWLHVRHR